MTVRQLVLVQVREGEVEYRATFFYNVLYSGIKSLRVDLPAELAPKVRNLTRSVHEKLLDPAPADLPKGYVAWSFSGDAELFGDGSIELTWKSPSPLETGGAVAVEVPRLIPAGVDRAWGQIVLAKADSIDLQEDPNRQKGLRPIDPQHDLMQGALRGAAARAYEFHEEWQLALTATRYQLEEIKHTSIERAVVRLVVTRAQRIAVQSLYRIRSAEQRLLVRLPEDVKIDVAPRINGKSVTLERGQDREFFVPLAGTTAEEPFLLEIRYLAPGDGRRLEYPEFLQEPAVQKVYLAVYLPEERSLAGHRGPWTEEYSWYLDSWGNWRPQPNLDPRALLAWVTDQRPTPGIDDFATDGRMYLFSTLQPASPETAALRLAYVKQGYLRTAVFGLLLLGGVALLGAAGPRGCWQQAECSFF